MTEPQPSFAEKLAHWRRHGLGVARPGRRTATHTTPVLSDHDGGQVGTQTEHWSGRVDATAQRVNVHVNPSLKIVRQDDNGPA